MYIILHYKTLCVCARVRVNTGKKYCGRDIVIVKTKTDCSVEMEEDDRLTDARIQSTTNNSIQYAVFFLL